MIALFSSQVTQLKSFKIRQRQQIIAIAVSMLTPMQKISLRIIKLILLIPVFLSLAYIEGWLLLPVLLVAGLSYPLLTTPVEIQFSKHYLSKAIKQFEQGE
ncbi:MAG: hypothetical protein ACJAVX_000981 [Pseudoalteromonas rhizosphaerae]|jgi:uncharacterized protein YqhQ|uniref:Uncharacterized protein n=1 Tax=Pseudoalteromonas neustonica TaxID=1840331 RepID=A0ABY3FBX6_9GAMM|nr:MULTISPECIES: DUF6170 family protein [Pseudoalteromonas]MBB1293631.1 hypothetical protein [Pseudoalteromonas sp. SR41-4]MBB1300547.1 hypothetical protein [Pseudoalteromonas sp. SR44-8]MBB1309521.1 hypothetical protein [Pseudoalteromonas sp. SR41-8]MBB1409270.1 hypothetical protein [Pseudoalteromonas sp. SG44-17]MBB1504980.1 hypothetical protein [Pseudoalteromonas sp. SG41-1]|tara:strand:+ start:6188 stop:6490 length:303 start_codon:yes stop_codon:yes gene_type:complete